MQPNLTEEKEYLEIVKGKLLYSLQKLNEIVSNYEKDYLESKQYLAENWNDLDSMEKFSNQRSINQIENSGKHFVETRAKIEKLIHSPYFSRIDFRYDGDDEAEQIYIGKFTFSDDNNDILIFDWRAPISNLYYEYELGRASFEAPIGEIEGDILLKRQYKIVNGNMEYALESCINIDDDILSKELSITSDKKMKNIIATIQREQNQIIRNDKSNILIIQGVAGSGKTSIALHRVAYLLYRNKGRLSAGNIAIISPNKVFADYISNVLPELGEEPILEISFEDIATEELCEVIDYEPYSEQVENFNSKWIEKVKFKSSMEFLTLINEYMKYASDRYFEPIDCIFGEFKIEKGYILNRYEAYSKRPIFSRFSEMASDIFDRMKTSNIRDYKLPTQNEIIKKLKPMFKKNTTLQLYTDFYQYINKTEMFEMADKNKLEWLDVFPYLYFKIFIEGNLGFESIQHIVIDEMQDYTPIQYAVIQKVFQCKKTILGDFGQSVTPYNGFSMKDFNYIFNDVEFVELNKSYRSTYEIIKFAKRIKNNQSIEAVERHGEEPILITCKNYQSELATLIEKTNEFNHGGYSTLGILCKSSHQSKELYEEMKTHFELHFLDINSTKFENGITITTIPVSKGLEFDEVIIPFFNNENYNTLYDQNLLYVACTRAMHKIVLTYQGEITNLLIKE